MNHTRTLLYQNGFVYPSIGRHIPVELVSPKKVARVVPKTIEQVIPKTIEKVLPKTIEQVVPKTIEQVMPKTGDEFLFKGGEFNKPFYFIIADQFHLGHGKDYLLHNIGKNFYIDHRNVYQLCHIEISFEGKITNDKTNLIIYALHSGTKHILVNVSITPSFEEIVHVTKDFKEIGVVSFFAKLVPETQTNVKGYLNISIHGSISTTTTEE